MKHTTKKLFAIVIAAALVFSFSLSAFADSTTKFSDTKTYKFIDDIATNKAITAYVSDISSDSLKVSDIVVSAKINGSKVDAKGKASIALGSLNAEAYFDGANLYGYIFIFKINATQLLENYGVTDIDIGDYSELLDAFEEYKNDPVINALQVADDSTAAKEKFYVSPYALICNLAGVTEQQFLDAAALAGQDLAGKTDTEIKDAIIALNNDGKLLPIIKILDPDTTLTQAELDSYMEYAKCTFEFDYNGDMLTNFVIYNEDGSIKEQMKDMLPVSIKGIVAGETEISDPAPIFSFDITSLISGFLGTIISALS